MKFTITCFLFLYVSLSQYVIGQQVEHGEPISCGTSDVLMKPEMLKIIQSARPLSSARLAGENMRELRLAVVVDYTIYNAFRQDTNAIRESVLKSVRTTSDYFFEPQLNIRINVVHIEFLKENRSYNSLDGLYHLDKFISDYQKRTDIKREVMMLWSVHKAEIYGGLANTIGFDTPNPTIHCTTLNTERDISPALIAHELGHVAGSPHTHACDWPDGPFEICSNTGICSEGINHTWGSIMSYCEVGGYFHPLSIDVIKKASYPALSQIAEKPGQKTVLIYPRQGQVGFYPSGFLIWSAVEKATAYEFSIAESTDFSTTVLDSVLKDPMVYLRTPLKRNTSYYWRVRAVNSFGKGEWSGVFSFITHSAFQLRTPVLQLPDYSRAGPDVMLSFKPVNDAKGYVVQFMNQSGSQLVKEQFMEGTSFRLGDFAYFENPYSWRVKAVNGNLSGDWSELQPISFYKKAKLSPYRLNVPISIPFLFSDIVTGWDLTLKLPESLDKTYEFQLSEDYDFKRIVLEKKRKHNYKGEPTYGDFYNAIILDSLKMNQRYFYRYRVKTSIDSSDWVAHYFLTSPEKRWKTFHYENSILPFNAALTNVFLDRRGNRWIYGRGGIFMISSDGLQQKKFSFGSTPGIVSNNFLSIAQGAEDRMWMGTMNGLMSYNNGEWKHYPHTLWSNNKNNGVIESVTVSNKNIVYFETGYQNRIIRYDGKTFQDVSSGSNILPSYPISLRTDNEGRLWVIMGTQYGDIIRIFDGTAWFDYPATEMLFRDSDGYPSRLDNEGNIYALFKNKLIRIKDASGNYESFDMRSINAFDDRNGKMITIDLYPDLLPRYIYVSGDRTYFSVEYQGNLVYLETDGKSWWLRQYLGGTGTYGAPPPVVDVNGKFSVLQGYNVLEEFDPKNIIAGFSQKSVITGCSIKYQVGIASPPEGNAEQNNLRVFLSDSSSATFRQIPAVYSKGEVTFSLPANLKGKGYRFKYTMGNNWIESKESEAFDILTGLTIEGLPFVCPGETTTLSVISTGTAPFTYQWMAGTEKVGTSSQVQVSKSGNYQVTVTDATGCRVSSNVLEVKELPKMETALSGDSFYCFGDSTGLSLTVTGGLPPYSYQWMKTEEKVGANASQYAVKQAGVYHALIKDSNGCTSTSQNHTVSERKISVAVTPSEPATVYRPLSVTLNASKTEGGQYQWKNNNINIPGATETVYEAKESGNYSVEVKSQGCTASSNVVKVSIETPLASEPVIPGNRELTVAPNPAHEMVEIRLTSSKVFPVYVELTDVNGKILKKWMLNEMSDSHRLSVSLSGYPSGVYFVKASNKEEVLVRKLLKQ